MNHNPLISVIVPVYNAESTLRRCVGSILNQTFKEFELLLIDDGSQDESDLICDDYACRDIRIKVFHKPNGGVASARNCGLNNARGKWIAFCDSDDFVYPEWLENFKLSKNLKYDLIIQGVRIEYSATEIYDVESKKEIINESNFKDIIYLLNQQGSVGYTVTKLFNRALIELDGRELRFNSNYDFMEDEDFVCKYLLRCRSVIYTCGLGYHYYLSPNKYDILSWRRLSQYLDLLSEIRLVSRGEITAVEKKYLDSIFVILVAECQRNSFNKESMLSLRKYVIEEFRHCPIILPTKIILALDPTGFFSALWLKLHLKIKKVDYTHD